MQKITHTAGRRRTGMTIGEIAKHVAAVGAAGGRNDSETRAFVTPLGKVKRIETTIESMFDDDGKSDPGEPGVKPDDY